MRIPPLEGNPSKSVRKKTKNIGAQKTSKFKAPASEIQAVKPLLGVFDGGKSRFRCRFPASGGRFVGEETGPGKWSYYVVPQKI